MYRSPLTDITTQKRLALALIVVATLNALLWSFVGRPGSGGPDEDAHFRTVNTMVRTGALAEFKGYPPGRFSGLAIRAQVAHEITPNALAIPVAITIAVIGSNDYAFNIHVARLFMVALYPVTLWFSFLTLRRLFPDTPVAPILGVTVMSTVPMFVMVHTYYTNDAPAIASSTIATYAIVRAVQSGFPVRDIILLGVSLGIVGLHKYTGFLVFPATAFVLTWHFIRQPKRLVQVATTILLTAATIASWWYFRNWILYGDPIGVAFTQVAVDASGGAPVPPRSRGQSPTEFVEDTNWIAENFATFWAGHGQHRIKLPSAAYLALSSLMAAATLGLIVGVVRQIRSRRLGINFLILAVMAAMHLGLWTVSFWSSYTVDVALHGRYVFPTFLPFLVLIITGLSSITDWRGRFEAVVLMILPLMLAANSAYFIHSILPDVNY